MSAPFGGTEQEMNPDGFSVDHSLREVECGCPVVHWRIHIISVFRG